MGGAKTASRRAPDHPPPGSSTADAQADRLFDELTTCTECVAAGYGWSTRKQRCGGYRNKRCDASSVPDNAAASSAAGPWMLGSPSGSVGHMTESATSARSWLDAVDSQSSSSALGVVLVVALAWWALRLVWQTQASGLGRRALGSSGSTVSRKERIDVEASGAERAAAPGRRHRRGRTTPPAPPCSVLRNGFSTKDVTRACDTSRTALRFAPTPEVRFFKPWQQRSAAGQSYPRKKQVVAPELVDPTGSITAQTQNNGGDCGVTNRTQSSKPTQRGTPAAVLAAAPTPVQPDLAYIFGPP